MGRKKFIVKDWAGNILCYDGKFRRPDFAVAKEFNYFDEAWGFLYEKYDHLSEKDFNEQMEEFHVDEA